MSVVFRSRMTPRDSTTVAPAMAPSGSCSRPPDERPDRRSMNPHLTNPQTSWLVRRLRQA